MSRKKEHQVDKPPKPKYSLEELLVQCDPKASPSDRDREWLESGSVGREIL